MGVQRQKTNNNSRTMSQRKLQNVRVSMMTAHKGRSPLTSEAAQIEAEAFLLYINFCQLKIDTNLCIHAQVDMRPGRDLGPSSFPPYFNFINMASSEDDLNDVEAETELKICHGDQKESLLNVISTEALPTDV